MNKSSPPSHKTSTIALRIIPAVMGLAVAGIFVGSTVLLFSATVDIAISIWETFASAEGHESGFLRLAMIEAVDTILVSTVLYVIAIGLFQLFVSDRIRLPGWLHTDDVGDLEQRLAGMVVTVVSVIFLTKALEYQDNLALLNSGLGIAAVIVAISLFLYVEARHKVHNGGEEDE